MKGVDKLSSCIVDCCLRAVELDPKQLRAIRMLGLTYQLTGRLDKAEAEFRRASTIAPTDGESWFYLGRVYYLQNFFDKAREALGLPGDTCLAIPAFMSALV